MPSFSSSVKGSAKILAQALSASLPEHESWAIAKEWACHCANCSPTQLATDSQLAFSPAQLAHFEAGASRLLQHEPLQHLIGEAHFAGREFFVGPEALIPRGETEELLLLIYKKISNPTPRALDIGTGTGCLAISIALDRPGSQVTATDLSLDALQLAKRNAARHTAEVDFRWHDILGGPDPRFSDLDLIVSNPPYIRESEKAEMEANVREHEPHMALFVPNEDPLVFYKRIGRLGTEWLKSGGMLFFEVNEALAQEVAWKLRHYGYRNVCVERDIHGKERMVWAVWP